MAQYNNNRKALQTREGGSKKLLQIALRNVWMTQVATIIEMRINIVLSPPKSKFINASNQTRP